MRAAFLDTVGLVAVWDESDQWHADAAAVYDELIAARARLITTPFVLAECGNAAARRPYRTVVAQFRRQMEAAKLLIHPTADDWAAAWAAYESSPPGGPGIVDCISFQVMRRLGLIEAFTNDRHFRAAGFVPLF